jgi:hypothetical protein
VFQVAIPQHFGYVCHTHWRTGMPGIGFLHGIHTQCTDGIGQVYTLSHVLLLF